MDFAVVGAGRIGVLRAQSVVARKDCRLVAVSDPNQAAAAAAAGATGAKVFADHKEMLAAAKPAAVICSAPVHLHEAICVDAFAAGCQVLCEKPLASTSAPARRIVDAAKKAGRTLAVGFNHRYYPAFEFLKKCLDDKLLGRIDHARAFGGPRHALLGRLAVVVDPQEARPVGARLPGPEIGHLGVLECGERDEDRGEHGHLLPLLIPSASTDVRDFRASRAYRESTGIILTA